MLESIAAVRPENNNPNSSKETLARELMDLCGASKLGEQVMESMLTMLADDTDEEFVRKFLSLAKPEQLVEMVVPIYTAHFDEETLHALIDFYNTPAGVKLIAAMPAITEASMMAGQEWGTKLATQL